MEQYSIDIAWSDEDEGYVARVQEFPDLYAFGDTRAEALKEGEDALRGYIALYGDLGKPLPAPAKRSSHSGQLRVRMPVSLHRALAMAARREGTSLNQWIVSLLSAGAASADTYGAERPSPTAKHFGASASERSSAYRIAETPDPATD